VSASWKATRKDAIAAQDLIDQSLVALRTAETALASARKQAGTAAAALAESQRQSKIKADANAAIAAALEQAKQALGKLTTDADLKLVVEKLQAKSTQLATELQTLSKTLQTQAEAAEKASAAVQAAQKNVKELTAKVQEAEEHGQPSLAKSNAARRDLQRAKADLAVRERRLQIAKLVTEYRTKADLLAKAQLEAGSAPSELEVARNAREEAAGRSRLNQRRLTKFERELDSLRQQVIAGRAALDARQPAIESLPAPTEQIEKTAAVVKDEELTRAAATVRKRLAALVAASAAARKQLAEQESACQALSAKCETLSKEKPDLDSALAATEAKFAQVEAQHKKPLADLQAALTQSDSARQHLLESLAEIYAIAPLKPLSAEQMHWSVLQASGILASYESAAEAELNKNQPPTDAQKADAAFKKQRGIALEREVHGKLAGNLAPFVQLFGCGPGQSQFEFFATADQALFMENSDMIRAWTAPGITLIQRLIQRSQPAAIAEELYLSALNRMPTAAETKDVAKWLARRDGPTPATIGELAWAVLASVEFRFNH
jgi:myosin heavy subunit